jgi:hypothetical protein
VREADLPAGFPEPTPVGEVELKDYPAYRCVRTDAGGSAFWKLFRHIEANEIAMTAPVEMAWSATDDDLRPADMAFLFGEPTIGSPGEAGPVDVVDEGRRTVLSIGCRGNDSERAVRAARERLLGWLADRPAYVADGDLRVLGYNSPMVRSSKRYFEVQLPVARRLVAFDDLRALDRWRAVDDRVMGGVSRSALEPTDAGTATFAGTMSKDNNGGFASVRTELPDGAFDGVERVRLRFRGDGQRYKLRLRTSRAFDGVNHEVAFDTFPDLWMELEFDLDAFVPVWRGRRVRDVPALRGADVVGVGFLISDDQEGDFRLEVASLVGV